MELVYFVWISEQTANFALHSFINRFLKHRWSLLRGTDRVLK